MLLAEIVKMLKGGHVVFLRQVTGNMARRQWDGTCRVAELESVLKEEGTHKLGTYLDKHQTTVAEWVALRPIYEFFGRDTGY